MLKGTWVEETHSAVQLTLAMPNKGACLQSMVTARRNLFRGAMPQPVSRKGLLALAPLGGRGPGSIWIRYCAAYRLLHRAFLSLILQGTHISLHKHVEALLNRQHEWWSLTYVGSCRSGCNARLITCVPMTVTLTWTSSAYLPHKCSVAQKPAHIMLCCRAAIKFTIYTVEPF